MVEAIQRSLDPNFMLALKDILIMPSDLNIDLVQQVDLGLRRSQQY